MADERDVRPATVTTSVYVTKTEVQWPAMPTEDGHGLGLVHGRHGNECLPVFILSAFLLATTASRGPPIAGWAGGGAGGAIGAGGLVGGKEAHSLQQYS